MEYETTMANCYSLTDNHIVIQAWRLWMVYLCQSLQGMIDPE